MIRVPRFPVSVLVAFALAACASDDGSPLAPGIEGNPPPTIQAEVVTLVDLVNARRVAEGCAPLVWHDGVAAVADAHSADMRDRDFFAHTNPDGKSPFDRLRDAGIDWSGAAGENIAWGTSSGQTAFDMWINSSGHRANIENCAFTHHGVGLVDARWTHLFVQNPAD
ncbi:MAG: CAP domain-containing protein [Gemmatimonadota bacterium]